MSSCGGNHPKWRDDKIDSLAYILHECEESMTQDNDELRKRSAKITSTINKLQRFASDTFTHDFIRSIDQYMASQKIYDRFLKQFPEMFVELNALKTQVLSLKKTSEDGKLTDDQFKKFISTEREDVLKLHEVCEEVAEPVTKLEPLYMRISPKIEAFADSLEAGQVKVP